MTTVNSGRGRPRKSLGQHFLADGAILGRIVNAAELTDQDTVVEVGPGLGSLTRRLAQQAGQVIALEIDPHLAASLASRLNNPANLTVVQSDARTIDLAALLGGQASYKVVANLPYYAANPIVRRFLEADLPPSLMVVMLQKEVAQIMVAKPGNMGILSVAVQYYAEARMVCSVPPRAFRPPPKVSSSVVRLNVRAQPAVIVDDVAGFFKLVRAGFSARRKQLRNSLVQGLGDPAPKVDALLVSADIDGRRRAETLTLDEWAEIYRCWEQQGAIASASLRQD